MDKLEDTGDKTKEEKKEEAAADNQEASLIAVELGNMRVEVLQGIASVQK